MPFALFRPPPLAVPGKLADAAEETPAQQQARMSASSATRELDELMASLSDFKVQSNVSDAPILPILHSMCISFSNSKMRHSHERERTLGRAVKSLMELESRSFYVHMECIVGMHWYLY